MLRPMLSDAVDEARSTASGVPTPTEQSGPDGREYPEKLDAALLQIGAICLLATILAVLDSTVVAVAQRTFIDQFRSTPTVVSWTVAGYMLAFATVIPITGWAADRFGTKRLFMGSVLLFTVGSLLCALSPDIWSLIVFRVVQGIGGGLLLPLSFVILTREAGPHRVGRLMALGGLPILIGPIGGPILGGWLIGTWGWQWIFLINLPIGLAAFVLAGIVFPKDHSAPSEPLDVIGVLLLSPGVAMLLIGVSSIPARHTVADRYVLIPVIVGLALITAFVVHAYRVDHPLIDLQLFKNRVVTQANVTMLVFGAAFVGIGLLVPSYLQVVLQETPMRAGLHMVPVGLGAALTMPLAGATMDKHGPGKIMAIGLPLMAAGLGIFTFGVATQAAYLPTLAVGLTIMGLGIGCTTTPLSAVALGSLAPHQVARGTTLLTVNQQVSGSIGASFIAVVLTNLFDRSENITIANRIATVQADASRRGVPVDSSALPRQGLAPDFASNLLHDLSHAYTTVFVIAGLLVLLTIIPASFLPRKPVGQTAPLPI
jgi:MFS transporter, DHA2 family, multidrug resistance protein